MPFPFADRAVRVPRTLYDDRSIWLQQIMLTLAPRCRLGSGSERIAKVLHRFAIGTVSRHRIAPCGDRTLHSRPQPLDLGAEPIALSASLELSLQRGFQLGAEAVVIGL